MALRNQKSFFQLYKRPFWISCAAHLFVLTFIVFSPKFAFHKPKTKIVWVALPVGTSEEVEIKIEEAKNLPQSTIKEQKEWLKTKEIVEKETKGTTPKIEKKQTLRPIQPEPKPKKPKQKSDIEKALAALDKKKSKPPEAAQVKDQGEGFKYGTSLDPLHVPPSDPEYIAYQAKVRAKIIDQWILPLSYLEGSAPPKSQIVVQINDKGEIILVAWEARSGNEAFDSSCQRAVQRATPLPIPPERLQWEAYNEGFLVEFDPSLKQQ